MSHSGDVEGPVLPSVPPPPVHKVRAEDIVTEVGKKAGKDESSQSRQSVPSHATGTDVRYPPRRKIATYIVLLHAAHHTESRPAVFVLPTVLSRQPSRRQRGKPKPPCLERGSLYPASPVGRSCARLIVRWSGPSSSNASCRPLCVVT